MQTMADQESHEGLEEIGWIKRIDSYGRDHPQLSAFIKSIEGRPIDVDIVEIRPSRMAHSHVS